MPRASIVVTLSSGSERLPRCSSEERSHRTRAGPDCLEKSRTVLDGFDPDDDDEIAAAGVRMRDRRAPSNESVLD